MIWRRIRTFFARYQDFKVNSNESWQQQMLALHNAQRVGLKPLVINDKLETAANLHAVWMAENNDMTHSGADGSMVDRINAQGYPWSTLGENIAEGYISVESVVQGWMSDYGHRMNILNPAFIQVGFGKAKSSNGSIYWCADFGHPA